MKTLEERAMEYAVRIWPDDHPKQLNSALGYRAGAESERAELTRWNDSKKSEPASGTLVLGKYHNDDPDEVGYVACQYVDGWFYTHDEDCLNEEDEPTHWRPIYE